MLSGSHQIMELTEKLEPFGLGNPRPVLALTNVNFRNLMLSRDNKHVRGLIETEGVMHPLIGFDQGKNIGEIGRAKDIAFHLKPDDYHINGYSLHLQGWR
jgi:hypothetical protein